MNHSKLLSVAFAIILLCGCEKFLDEKADKKLVIASSLSDLQSLLDNFGHVNAVSPGEGELASDDYYLLHDTWVSRSEADQRAYIWEPDHSTTESNWRSTYRIVYYANIVLENLNKIERTPFNQRHWDNLKGQALFLRANCFLNIVGVWSLAYDENSSSSDLGIPLRLGDDFNIPSVRASVEETYGQIISDLRAAVELLPDAPEHIARASKPAALALLARTYLFMRDYGKCLIYSNACLELKNDLMDYNDLEPSPTYPIPIFNKETLYFSIVAVSTNPTINVNNALVDTVLYESYLPGDLRKILFFRRNNNGTNSIRGNYSGSASRFTGLAVDEVYLMRAECYARQNNIEAALADLNLLLSHRYSNTTPYVPLSTTIQQDVLQLVLAERRKQLIMRGLRFPDVKRLNKEGALIGFKRMLNGTEYILPPNDLRFALPIPESVLELAPSIKQNLR